MLKIGIIGSEDTVDKILELSDEFKNQVEFVSLKYKDKSETLSLVHEGQAHSDVMLYSGQAPYMMAYHAGVIEKPSLYIPRSGTSLYKALWAINKDNIKLNGISTEALPEKEIIETLNELDVTLDRVYFNDINFARDLSYVELSDFHYNLWKDGKIDVALTGFTKVFQILKERGMPAYKLYPTIHLIREYINKAILLGKVNSIQKTQTAVQVIRLRSRKEQKSNNYDFDMIKNKLESTLIKYTRDNLGSLFPSGKDEYLIFTNRGSIEQTYNFFDFKNEWDREDTLNTILSSGIGYGDNVHEAELNSRVALEHSLGKDFDCTYLMDESGNITGPFSDEKSEVLTYDVSAGKDEKIRGIAEKTSLSPAYISKIQNLISKLNRDELDATVVSSYLGISDRSARRILGALVESGFGEVMHSESKAKTGRPRKIYKIRL